jgi:cytochrome c
MSARTDRVLGGLAAALLALVATAHAETVLSDEQARALFEEQYCNACHEVDETRLGPAFRTVGLRYREASPGAGAEGWLAAKIVTGGAGAWGNVPMVSYPRLPPEDARALARWILGLGKKPPPTPKPEP